MKLSQVNAEADPGLVRFFSARYENLVDGSRLVISNKGQEFSTSLNGVSLSDNPHSRWWHNYLMGGDVIARRDRGTLRIADLFCGSGGLSQGVTLGALSLGYRVKHQLAVDIDNDALRVTMANHRPKIAINESTANLVSYSLRHVGEEVAFAQMPVIQNQQVESLVGEIDVVMGGPPCQGHSTANKNRKFFDARNLLYLTVPALAIALDAPVVIIENVPGVQASQQGVVQNTWKILESYGYSVTGAVINAADIGWAQSRRRYFMVGSKMSVPLDLKSVIIPSLRHPATPISEVIGDLVDHEGGTFMTQLSDMSEENSKRMRFLHEHDLHDLPDSERNRSAREGGTTYRAVYGRMFWDKPAQTITTGFMTPGRGRYVHPLRPRTLLPLEAARLQGFPDTYIFDAFGQIPARTSLAKWIGDAVPTPLGFAAALSAFTEFHD